MMTTVGKQEYNRLVYSLAADEVKKLGYDKFRLFEGMYLPIGEGEHGWCEPWAYVAIEVEPAAEDGTIRFVGKGCMDAVSKIPPRPIKVKTKQESTDALKKITFTMSNEPNLVISKKLLQSKSNPFYNKTYYQY